jgi:hypothetical protein
LVRDGGSGETNGLAAAAAAAHLQLIDAAPAPTSAAAGRALREVCSRARVAVDRCAIHVQTWPQARRWLAQGRVDFVVLSVTDVGQFLALPRNTSRRSRLIVTVPLGSARIDLSWRRAIALATTDPSTVLAVDAGRPPRGRVLRGFLAVVAVGGRTDRPIGMPRVANIWVDPNGGSCMRRAVAAQYSGAQACGSFNAAYLAAAPGDTVAVEPGGYGRQRIADRPGLPIGSRRVTFCVAPGGGSVTLDSGDAGVSDLAVAAHDITISGANCGLSGQQKDRLTLATTGDGLFVCYSTGVAPCDGSTPVE